MTETTRRCPRCDTRVRPMDDGTCPACRQESSPQRTTAADCASGDFSVALGNSAAPATKLGESRSAGDAKLTLSPLPDSPKPEGTTNCPHCEESIQVNAAFAGQFIACPACGRPFQLVCPGATPQAATTHFTLPPRRKSGLVAFLLSLLCLPGLGHFYNGQLLNGVIFLVLPVAWFVVPACILDVMPPLADFLIPILVPGFFVIRLADPIVAYISADRINSRRMRRWREAMTGGAATGEHPG